MARTKHPAATRYSGHSTKVANKAPTKVQENPLKTRRSKTGKLALREIRHFQSTTKLLIPAAPFVRAVREITLYYSLEVGRWELEALVALQEAAEDYVVELFKDSMLCAIHANRKTLRKEDWELARRLQGKGRLW